MNNKHLKSFISFSASLKRIMIKVTTYIHNFTNNCFVILMNYVSLVFNLYTRICDTNCSCYCFNRIYHYVLEYIKKTKCLEPVLVYILFTSTLLYIKRNISHVIQMLWA
jgi:hypothetical protein